MPVNKRPGSPNSFFGEDEFGLADVGRLVKGLEQEPAALREMRLRLKTAQTKIAAVNSLDPQSRKLPVFTKMKIAGKRAEESLVPRIDLYEASRQDRTTSQVVNSIGRNLSDSSINSYVARNVNSMENQGAGLLGASKNNYSELKKRQSSIREEMGRVRNRALNSAENLYDEEGNVDQGSVRKMHKSQARFKGLANELTTVTSSIDQAKRQGLDPQSRLLALTRAQQNASGVLNTNNIEEQMKNRTGLGALSPQDLKQKETDASLKLIKAMDELRNSFGKGDEVMEKFATNAENAAKELEEVQEAQGMSGGGGKYEDGKIIAGSIMEALSIITTGFQNVAINQPMQMVSNAQGAANIENEKYNMWHSALGGDMTARMSLGAWAVGDAFGEQQAGRQAIVHGAKLANNTIGAGLGVAQMVAGAAGTGGTFLGNNVVTNVAQGATTTISGLTADVVEGAALYRQTEMAKLRIDGTHAVVNASKAINHIPGHQLQKYRDYTMGLNEASSQMGGDAGESFLNETGGTGFIEKMRKEGVGLKEMGTLSGQGANLMGSMFRSSQVIDSVHLENKGIGTAEQNMHRMGLLGAAGTQDPSQNLSKIIEEGMQRGLNSSKAIDMLVENTARMTEDNAMAGGTSDPTEFLTKSIMSAINQNNPNKEMAGNIAYKAYETGEAARHNISTSFSGIVNVDRNAKDLGLGTDRMGATLLTQMSTAMLNSLKGKSADEVKNSLEARGMSRKTMQGMDQSLFENDKMVNILNRNASVSELAQSSGVGYAIGSPGKLLALGEKYKDNPAALAALRDGKNLNLLTDEERQLRSQVAAGFSINNKNPDAQISNAFAQAGYGGEKLNDKTIKDITNTTKGAAQSEKRLGNVADADTAIQGGSALGANAGGAEGIKNLAETGRIAFEKAGKDAEKMWGEAASKTAANFGKSSDLLDKASGKLDSVAEKLNGATDSWKVVTESFGATIKKLMNEITKKTDESVHKLEKH